MHLIIGLFILIGIATFVVFAFWQGMGAVARIMVRASALMADPVTQPMVDLGTVRSRREFACLAIKCWRL